MIGSGERGMIPGRYRAGGGRAMAKIVAKIARSKEEYIADRVEPKINQYRRNGLTYRWVYRLMASGAAIGAAIVPALISQQEGSPMAATVIGLGVAAIVAVQSVIHPRELSRSYDLICARLREEEMRFSAGLGRQKNGKTLSEEEAFLEFVDRIEDLIASERAETIMLRTADGAAKTTSSQQLHPLAPTDSGNGRQGIAAT
jgi:hypothetical protein